MSIRYRGVQVPTASARKPPTHRQLLAKAGIRLAGRRRLVKGVSAALADGRGYALGKIGRSEKLWLGYPPFRAQEQDQRRLRAYEAMLQFHCCRQSGIFPTDPDFLYRFAMFHRDCVGRLDNLGLFLDDLQLEVELVRGLGFAGDCSYFQDQQPPKKDGLGADCYLQSFVDRDVVVINPFAHFLAGRLNRETYEAVWSKTGKRWFYPASVRSLEFPYGFEPATRQRYRDVFELYDEILERLETTRFDVALIGAGGLGIPLAIHVKRMGRTGLSLGGYLQVICGVLGARWRDNRQWCERYVTGCWVDLPADYRPGSTMDSPDSGAYW